MKRENWIVGDHAIRPAGSPDRCFYCGSKKGFPHKNDCVIRCRTAVVEFTIRMVTEEPEDWTPSDIEFHYNDGSWCSDNLLDRLGERTNHHCLCDIAKAKYIREATEEDEKDYGVVFVNELKS